MHAKRRLIGAIVGRSLLRLLRRPAAPPDWRSAALIEHHGPADEPNDPDRATGNAGDPTSYEALRTRHALYVEYSTGEHEYYDLARDPWELVNRYPRLPAPARARLHRRLAALERCSGRNSCRRAGRAPSALQG
jgi:N-acetylglucosamine-6-sulfatase